MAMRNLRLAARYRYTDGQPGRDGEPVIPRAHALRELLRPIKWDWSSSTRSKQNVVIARHKLVRAAFPFMDPAEQMAARHWFSDEGHGDLWE